MDYERYDSFEFIRHARGVVELGLARAGSLPVADARAHAQLADVWRDLDRDPEVSVVVVRGREKGFSGGGSLDMVAAMADDFDTRSRVWREARDLVYGMLDCSKIIVSAIHGPAVGAGLAVALLADISVAAKDARLIDGHTRLGVAAGDHAAIVWPLLCGMARAKLHLLLSDEVSGEEAERIGLVSKAVAADEVLPTALDLARRLAEGPQAALRWTKLSLNQWLRQAAPIFEQSLALEMCGFSGPELRAGLDALRAKRVPDFPPQAPF